MTPEESANETASRSHSRDSEPSTKGAWTITAADPDFPSELASYPQFADWDQLYGVGNRNILCRRRLGLICSVQCPGSVIIKTFDAIRELRDAGVVVIGGFHSPMEQDCLGFLLRGEQPVILCPARGIGGMRLREPCREAIAAGRLLLLSAFGDEVTRTSTAQAETRNEFVAALASVVVIPHASHGGKAAPLAQSVRQRGQPLYTIDDDQNTTLIELGARPYNIAEIKSVLTAARANEHNDPVAIGDPPSSSAEVAAG